MIERDLRKAFPEIAILGEGTIGDTGAEWRWVVDPIDGTVNFSRGLLHACVCIALQRRLPHLTGIGMITSLNWAWCMTRF